MPLDLLAQFAEGALPAVSWDGRDIAKIGFLLSMDVCVRPSHLDPAQPVGQAALSGVQQ